MIREIVPFKDLPHTPTLTIAILGTYLLRNPQVQDGKSNSPLHAYKNLYPLQDLSLTNMIFKSNQPDINRELAARLIELELHLTHPPIQYQLSLRYGIGSLNLHIQSSPETPTSQSVATTMLSRGSVLTMRR